MANSEFIEEIINWAKDDAKRLVQNAMEELNINKNEEKTKRILADAFKIALEEHSAKQKENYEHDSDPEVQRKETLKQAYPTMDHDEKEKMEPVRTTKQDETIKAFYKQ